jgi:hypothetical protein
MSKNLRLTVAVFGASLAVLIGVTAVMATSMETERPLEHKDDTSPKKVRHFWTPERIHEASQHGL